jgi:hypothetical protein
MNEKNFSPSRESGTPFENDGQVDLHTGNPDLISYEELEARRRRKAFEQEALGVITPEQRPLGPHERLGQLNAGVVHLRRRRLDQDSSNQAA